MRIPPRHMAYLSRFRWYRRRIGGHWECWYFEPIGRPFWQPLIFCSHGHPLSPQYRGTPACENWPDRGYWGHPVAWLVDVVNPLREG